MMLDPLIAESNFSLPTQDNLPCDDGVPMETERHKKQMELLIASLEPWLIQQPQGGYVSGNMFIYYSFKQIRRQDFKGLDVFVVLDVPPGERKSWVVWEEGKTPDLIIELLSESTAKKDKTNKKLIYQNQLKVAEYFWFDPFNPEDCADFRLHGNRYEAIPLENNRFLSQQLGLSLIRWSGTYRGVETTWLRWATLTGDLLLLPEESAQQQAQVAQRRVELVEQQLESETQRAQTAEQRAQVAEAEIARLKALLAQQTE
ncbi:MAG: Uma2 family endonuclease [Thioploca sp.]|nr:Uma2 family endonuclease [Thioploca sp.]